MNYSCLRKATMDFKVISYNVRGITMRVAKTRLKEFLQDEVHDIVYIQEHKMRSHEVRLLEKKIWNEGAVYSILAKDGTLR